MLEVGPKQIVEALFMASEEPLTIDKLHKVFIASGHAIAIDELNSVVNHLVEEYSVSGFELKEVASGWRFQIKQELSQWINKLHEERPPKYSRSLLEVLALIAYRQPITRAEIEGIRGVGVGSNIIKTLLDHEWIRIIGHKEVPGKPALFATTKKFLDHFNLKSLNELPSLLEFTENMVVDSSDASEKNNDGLIGDFASVTNVDAGKDSIDVGEKEGSGLIVVASD